MVFILLYVGKLCLVLQKGKSVIGFTFKHATGAIEYDISVEFNEMLYD